MDDTRKFAVEGRKVINEINNSNLGTEKPACNIGTYKLHKAVTGSNDLAGKKANDIYNHCQTSSNWEDISVNYNDLSAWKEAMRDMHNKVNQGAYIIAVYYNSIPGKSGHVVTLMPSEKMEATAWECKAVPLAMDTGSENRSTHR